MDFHSQNFTVRFTNFYISVTPLVRKLPEFKQLRRTWDPMQPWEKGFKFTIESYEFMGRYDLNCNSQTRKPIFEEKTWNLFLNVYLNFQSHCICRYSQTMLDRQNTNVLWKEFFTSSVAVSRMLKFDELQDISKGNINVFSNIKNRYGLWISSYENQLRQAWVDFQLSSGCWPFYS